MVCGAAGDGAERSFSAAFNLKETCEKASDGGGVPLALRPDL